MEQSDTQVCKAQENMPTDVGAHATHTMEIAADHGVTVATEDEGQELPNDTCVSSLSEPTSVLDTVRVCCMRSSASAEGVVDVASRDQSELDVSTNSATTRVASEHEQPELSRERASEKDTTVSCRSQRSCDEEDQSLNVITVSKVAETKEEEKEKEQKEEEEEEEEEVVVAAAAAESNDRHAIGDVNQLNTANRQYEVDKCELGDRSADGTHDESVKETIREICNNSSQNNAIVMDAELSKLVQEEEEEEEETGAVVVVVETIPVITADATANDFIVTTLDDSKDASKECNHDTVDGLQEKKLVESDRGDNEIDNPLDYSQEENEDTIIEVTEVIDAPIVEQRDDKDCPENVDKRDTEAIEIIDGKIAIDKGINGEYGESSVADNRDDNITIIIDKKIIITENDDLESTRNVSETKEEDTVESEREANRELSAMDSSMKKRSVIQDIFDDWGVENTDEDAPSKVHDSVEIELKSLLDETKTDQSESFVVIRDEISAGNEECVADGICDAVAADSSSEGHATKQSANESAENQKRRKATEGQGMDKNGKLTGKSSHIKMRSLNSMQSHGISKNHSRHLTSQIASPAEVTEVLKQRLREKQKTVVDAPRPDIFFVKKLTQRLSSRLAGSSKSPVLVGSQSLSPAAHSSSSSPSSTSVQSTSDNCDKRTEINKGSNADNKELLAILEGDVDPDWSVLNPPILTEESNKSSIQEPVQIGPPKLDPVLERELALKQLLELPIKKTPSRKKKTFQPAPGKAKDTRSSLGKKEVVVDVDLESESARANSESTKSQSCSTPRERTEEQNDWMTELMSTRTEESRSGRKRKPTEKAREHEQNTLKRQKVYRGKVPTDKRQTQDNDTTMKCIVMKESKIDDDDASNVRGGKNEATDKEFEEEAEPIRNSVVDNLEVERTKTNLAKKGPITKRKMIVKRLLRQKMPTNTKPIQLKTTKLSPSKKSPAKSQKRTSGEGTPGDGKPKKKSNEIDKLLQDEGVVNLLYDVEQPTKKRLVPITKSRAKVMDLQKVQRELKIRKKLVRNAVLRLRTSTTAGVAKVSPRSKRTAVHPTDIQSVDKRIGEQAASPKSLNSAALPTEFILPMKIRNAADASIIVRRHSSSSISSASGSPRVSVDSAGEKIAEITKSDDATAHSLRSAKKRRDLQEERLKRDNNAKKTRKKRSDTDIDNTDTDNVGTINSAFGAISTTINDSSSIISDGEEKVTITARSNKKSDIKKTVKQENVSTLGDNVSSKVTTRSSNGAVTTGKVTSKSRRTVKSKTCTRTGTNDADSTEESSKGEDELSVCLAEAATALSVVSSRSNSATVTRKRQASANSAKMDSDTKRAIKTETQSQFSNKEINVRRHGNLVQLILTPSASTKVRNALTLQVMQEFREALSILKKDDECRVVLLTSTGTSFCEGLDLSTLLHTNKEERRSVAQELAYAVKDFIKSLATFNKPIVAGVQGAAIGLGVTMLPLFDLVIASDKATFCTPYGKLGQIAEGAAVFTLSHILGSAITSELLLGGRTLTASEALRAGLVTRVLWPDRFQVELLPSLRAMSDQSSQSMEATKALLRHSLRKKLDAALESETYLLIQHWCSTECQTAIKAYIDGKIQ